MTLKTSGQTAAHTSDSAVPMRETLRQMLAVLQEERHALAGLDLDLIMGCASNKSALCGALAEAGNDNIDEECRGLLDAARRLNEANRRVRNLIAANVSSRLDALTGTTPLYRAGPQPHRLRTA